MKHYQACMLVNETNFCSDTDSFKSDESMREFEQSDAFYVALFTEVDTPDPIQVLKFQVSLSDSREVSGKRWKDIKKSVLSV